MKKSRRKKLLFYNFGLIAVIAGCTFSIFQMIPVSGASFMRQEEFKKQKNLAELDMEHILLSELNLDLTFSFLIADVTKEEVLTSSNILAPQKPLLFTIQMALLTALQYGDPKTKIALTKEQISSLFAEDPMFLAEPGDTFFLEDFLLYVIKSRNKATLPILAQAVSEDEKEFLKLMNQTAKELKTANTYFKNLLCREEEGEYTTVYDMYLISRELLTFDLVAESMNLSPALILYTKKDGTPSSFTVSKKQEEDALLLPDHYTKEDGFGFEDSSGEQYQFDYLKEEQGNLLFMISMGIPKNQNLETDIVKIKEALGSEVIVKNVEEKQTLDLPEEAILPTESDEARYQYLFGSGVQYYTVSNLPAGYESSSSAVKQMTTIQVPVWKMRENQSKYSAKYSLTVNKKLADSVKCIFDEIYALEIQFPIKYLVGYAYRKVGGVGLAKSDFMSIHSFGAAIDINPGDYDNDYFLGRGNDLRDKSNPYCIPDEVIEIFEKYGWFWGGNFSICADTMHFQYLGLDFLTYQGKNPFRTLEVQSSSMQGSDVNSLQKRLIRLGYRTYIDGKYTETTAQAVRRFQEDQGFAVTGIMDYKSWETIVNLTHDMEYVF